jgi:hypothetical protein
MIKESNTTTTRTQGLLMQDLFHSHCNYAHKAGPGGFELVGKVFIWHTVEQESSTVALVELLDLLKSGDNLKVFAWLKVNYPKHIQLVPPKKYAEFLKGVLSGAERLKLYVLPTLLEEEISIAEAYPRRRPSLLARLSPRQNGPVDLPRCRPTQYDTSFHNPGKETAWKRPCSRFGKS